MVVKTKPCEMCFTCCKSITSKSLSRDTKSARDKNETKPRKNKVKNTLLEIPLTEYLCFSCKGTYLSLDKRRKFPISLIINPYSDLCTLTMVIASGFALKLRSSQKLGVKYCFAFCLSFSKTRTGNRTNGVPLIMPNTVYMSV